MIKKILPALLITAFFYSCSEKNPYKTDTSGIAVNLEIKRLDKELFEIDYDSIAHKIPRLNNKYGDFFDLYNKNVIEIGGSNHKAYPDNLQAFLTDYFIHQAYEKTMELYPDLDDVEKKINEGFTNYKAHFPDKQIPALYTYIGGFNQSIVIGDSILAIGLDKYLGRDCEFYDKLSWSKYLIKNMHKAKIPTDGLKSWAETEWVFNDTINNLMSNMIYQGKLLYFTKSMFPEEADTLIMGFTEDELQWCRNNEQAIWDYLIENKLLFETEHMTINKYVNPAPFTAGFPRESPGRAINWLGWQIVEAYMERSNLSLPELMEEDDYQKIFTESKYHP
ncbi:MAG: hypothetical protein R6U04_14015 [Bacteroidales bacterium]